MPNSITQTQYPKETAAYLDRIRARYKISVYIPYNFKGGVMELFVKERTRNVCRIGSLL
jgi:hypothetical protein